MLSRMKKFKLFKGGADEVPLVSKNEQQEPSQDEQDDPDSDGPHRRTDHCALYKSASTSQPSGGVHLAHPLSSQRLRSGDSHHLPAPAAFLPEALSTPQYLTAALSLDIPPDSLASDIRTCPGTRSPSSQPPPALPISTDGLLPLIPVTEEPCSSPDWDDGVIHHRNKAPPFSGSCFQPPDPRAASPQGTLTVKPFSSDLGSASPDRDTARLLRSTKQPSNYKSIGELASMESNGKHVDGWSPYSSKTDIVQNGSSGKVSSAGRGNGAFVYVLACFATIGGLLFGYDTGIVSGSMLLIQPYFDLNTVWQETIVSGTIGAAAIFALLAGLACDVFGRKKTIMIASFIFAVGAIVMAVSPNKYVLLVGRIIVGMGIGFASMTVPVYVAESAPPDIRGRLVTLNQLFITIGILLSSIIAGAFSTMKDTGWRYMLGLAALPGVIQFLGFFYLPESPRWLVSKGRDEEARSVLKRIRGGADIEEEFKEVKDAESKKQTGVPLVQILKTPHVRKALIIGCLLQLFQQLCGINTVVYYSATIIKMAGFPPDQAIWLVCVPFAVNFLATFIGVWAVERLGRRILLVISFIGVAIALVVLAMGFYLSAKHSPSVNATIPVYFNGSQVTDECHQYTVCEDCVTNTHCGYCNDENQEGAATCLKVSDDDKDVYSAYGQCSKNSTGNMEWYYGYCPTDYSFMSVLGLALFVLSFAPGLGPMPWTINSEIYPMWARGTGNAISTMVNWAFNLVISFSFLSMLENITKYGTFFLFCGICIAGAIFTVLFVPETKNKSLEEVVELFMTPEERKKSEKERAAAKEITVKEPPANFDTRL